MAFIVIQHSENTSENVKDTQCNTATPESTEGNFFSHD
jgi:hypothetical protein